MPVDIIYGDTLCENNHIRFKTTTKSNPKYRMPFCHQSVFVKTKLLKKYHFDTSFKICADNDFFTKLYHLNHKSYKLNQIISIYNIDGVSSKYFFKTLVEDLKIGSKYNKFYPFMHAPKSLYMVLKYFIKKIIPTTMKHKIQAMLYEKP